MKLRLTLIIIFIIFALGLSWVQARFLYLVPGGGIARDYGGTVHYSLTSSMTVDSNDPNILIITNRVKVVE